jgi:hypothetical protein
MSWVTGWRKMMTDLVKFLRNMADDTMGMEPFDRLVLGECADRIIELEALLKLAYISSDIRLNIEWLKRYKALEVSDG